MSAKDALAERVLYLERARLDAVSLPESGFVETGADEVYARFLEDGAFEARRHLEEDPARKQAIPYVVVVDHDGKILTLSRKSSQTEKRLHGKVSFGVGGHIPDELAGSDDVLEDGMFRELHEELHVTSDVDPKFRGLLNDDSNAVGSVHLGFVFTCRVEPETVSVREVDKMDGQWLTLAELRELEDRMETWSALLLPHLESWITR